MIKNLVMNLLQRVIELGHKLGLIADYTVETGTSGAWTYEKWESGKAICYGRFLKTIAATTQWGGTWYYGSIASENFPSGLFNSQPFLTTVIESDGLALMGPQNANITKDHTGEAFGVRPNSYTAQYYIMYHAIGTWK